MKITAEDWRDGLSAEQEAFVRAGLNLGALGQVAQMAARAEIEKAQRGTRHMVCPSCKKEGDFTYCGRQEWPHRAAKDLWNCPACHSTISAEVEP